jgi:hypothetical protein
MSKTNTFRDLLVKIKSIFKTDIYLIHNQYIIGGEKSSADNIGYNVCMLSPDIIDVCNKIFDSSKIYYIKNVTNAKDDLDNNYIEVTSVAESELVKYSLEEILNIKNKCDTWDTFNFTNEQLNDLFENNVTISLFSNNENIPEVTISKSLFPLVTKKTASDLYYHVIKDQSYINLLIAFDFPMFQLVMLYRYIDISDNTKGDD